MTKVIVLGQSINENKELKPIEFSDVIENDYRISVIKSLPSDFKFIELICLNYSKGFDLMFAYNNPNERGRGVLVIGHFNDGVV